MSRKKRYQQGQGGTSHTQPYASRQHTHSGRKLLWQMPNGFGVYAGARADLSGRYAAILDCTGMPPVSSPRPPLVLYGAETDTAPYAGLVSYGVKPAARIAMDWPDGGIPPVLPEFWQALLDTVKGNLAVCCVGGHGRTGTALTSLFLAQHKELKNVTLSTAVQYIRNTHCMDAVETDEQVQYLEHLAYYLGVEAGEGITPSYVFRWQDSQPQYSSNGVVVSASVQTSKDAKDAECKVKPEGVA